MRMGDAVDVEIKFAIGGETGNAFVKTGELAPGGELFDGEAGVSGKR